MSKYYLSLCCIIKNERYLEEFINYYRILGVEHFYIFDNESFDPISKRLSNFYYDKICTIINYPGKALQLNAYEECLKKYGHETEWLIVCDGDEFILPKKHFSLRDFLDEYKDYHAIGINWVMFGTSYYDKIQDGYLIDKYRRCNKLQNSHIKTICKPKYTIQFIEPHSVILIDKSKYVDSHKNIINGPFNNNYTIDIIQINHYHGRSLEENYEKKYRGNADSINISHNVPENIHNLNNDIIDDLIANKYLDHIINLKKLIDTNYLIYKALNEDLVNLTDMNEIYNHIFYSSQSEKRPLCINDKYPSFSNEIYRKNYPNLNYLDDIYLQLHYIYNGIKNNDVCDRLIW